MAKDKKEMISQENIKKNIKGIKDKSTSFIQEFKQFIAKGNVMDLAVGVIIGGAFQKIVTSLVNDIIMPAISIITGKVDYSDLSFTVGDASIKYGAFLTSIIDFLIIALSIFIVIKYLSMVNKRAEELHKQNREKMKQQDWYKKLEEKRFNSKEEVTETIPEPTTKTCPFCLSEINIKASRCPHCTSEQTTTKEI